jgi:hypothetical protein
VSEACRQASPRNQARIDSASRHKQSAISHALSGSEEVNHVAATLACDFGIMRLDDAYIWMVLPVSEIHDSVRTKPGEAS